jgi:hypothetical protein
MDELLTRAGEVVTLLSKPGSDPGDQYFPPPTSPTSHNSLKLPVHRSVPLVSILPPPHVHLPFRELTSGCHSGLFDNSLHGFTEGQQTVTRTATPFTLVWKTEGGGGGDAHLGGHGCASIYYLQCIVKCAREVGVGRVEVTLSPCLQGIWRQNRMPAI